MQPGPLMRCRQQHRVMEFASRRCGHAARRLLHHTHHKYNKEHTLSPFAGLAFNALDGILQVRTARQCFTPKQ